MNIKDLLKKVGDWIPEWAVEGCLEGCFGVIVIGVLLVLGAIKLAALLR